MFKFDKILNFTNTQIKKYADDIKERHIDQMRMGIDADGQKFVEYTPKYARAKAIGRYPGQSSYGITPTNSTLPGEMFEKFIVHVAKVKNNIQIKYGIRASKVGLRLAANNQKREIADNQKLGPLVEEVIGSGIAEMVADNISKQHGAPVVLHI